MRSIKLILLLMLFTKYIFATDDDLDYLNKTPSSEYFKSMNPAEIVIYCDAHHGGTNEINFCEKRIFEQSDNKLNVLFEKITSKYKTNISEDKRILKKIVGAQHLWLQYREAECSMQYSLIGYGTMRGQQYFYCKNKLTIEREKILYDFHYNDYQ